MLRSRLPFAAALAAALALGACGSDSATDDSAAPAASAGQDAFPYAIDQVVPILAGGNSK
jgi:hypothetical protein